VVKVQSTTPATPDPEVKTESAAATTAEPASTDFGAKLRQARVKRGVSLEEIANASKISIAVLEELESNDISRLPQGVLGRGFIRSYATQVGLEPEATVAEFVERFPTESVTAGYQTLEQQIEEQQLEDMRRWSLPSLWSRPSPLLMAFAAGVVLLAACPLYLRRERSRPATARNSLGATKAKAGPRGLVSRPSPVGTPAAVETHRETTATAVASTESSGAALERPALPPESSTTRAESPTQTPPTGKSALEKPAVEKSVTEKRTIEKPAVEKPVVEKPPTEMPAKEKPTQEKPAKARPAAEAARARLAVVLSVTRPSWIIASVDGKRAVNRLLQVGEQESLDANTDLLLTTGDAGAVVMTVNGAAARPIGRPGQTVTVRVNPTNLKKFLAR